MQEPLLNELGFAGNGPKIEDILDGTYQATPGTDEYAEKLLQAMKRLQAVTTKGPVNIRVNGAQNTAFWKKQKETTSASPHGPSFSHYKAAAMDKELSEFDAHRQHGLGLRMWPF